MARILNITGQKFNFLTALEKQIKEINTVLLFGSFFATVATYVSSLRQKLRQEILSLADV